MIIQAATSWDVTFGKLSEISHDSQPIVSFFTQNGFETDGHLLMLSLNILHDKKKPVMYWSYQCLQLQDLISKTHMLHMVN